MGIVVGGIARLGGCFKFWRNDLTNFSLGEVYRENLRLHLLAHIYTALAAHSMAQVCTPCISVQNVLGTTYKCKNTWATSQRACKVSFSFEEGEKRKNSLGVSTIWVWRVVGGGGYIAVAVYVLPTDI